MKLSRCTFEVPQLVNKFKSFALVVRHVQLLQMVRSCARGAYGAQPYMKYEHMHMWGCGAQFEIRNKVTQVLAFDAQLRKGKKLCTLGLLVQN